MTRLKAETSSAALLANFAADRCSPYLQPRGGGGTLGESERDEI